MRWIGSGEAREAHFDSKKAYKTQSCDLVAAMSSEVEKLHTFSKLKLQERKYTILSAI